MKSTLSLVLTLSLTISAFPVVAKERPASFLLREADRLAADQDKGEAVIYRAP